MTLSSNSGVPPAKRRKLDHIAGSEVGGTCETSGSLHRPVSPPLARRQIRVAAAASRLVHAPSWCFNDVAKQTSAPLLYQPPPPHEQICQLVTINSEVLKNEKDNGVAENRLDYVASPFQLTKIRDMAPNQNVDTVELKDILGNPLIKECWNFNFLFDLDFLMQQFDEDVRDIVKVKIIHGFWKRDDERRIALMETAERYQNVETISAYLPDPFGTHHSKMLILFRHDDYAQVVIHTANMISKDWTNMTQAVWRSPLLPLSSASSSPDTPHDVGNGQRFKVDLLYYLGRYEKRLCRLSEQLTKYDFSAVRAAFLSSAPSRQLVSKANPNQQTLLGWLGLQKILSRVPILKQRESRNPPHIVLQISSIATLGATSIWLSHFQSILALSENPRQPLNKPKPKFNIIFPTPGEIRTSLNGYESGGSIHMKIHSAQQQKQLQYLQNSLCHWRHSSPNPPTSSAKPRKEAHRGPAAPHIKTYIRFSDDTHRTIDWALLTSANLSKQAWGDVVNKRGEVRIQSYETGVLVWPELFTELGSEVDMVPVFGKDVPDADECVRPGSRRGDGDDGDEQGATVINGEDTEDEEESGEQHHQSKTEQRVNNGKAALHNTDKKQILVGLRMPYDLPLSPYSASNTPWCATKQYDEPDWKGQTWHGW